MSNLEVLQRKHTRREFRERMQSGELKACIIPVAAIEQHLEHLAMEHDWRSVCHVAVTVAERLRPHALVAEGLMADMRGTAETLEDAFVRALGMESAAETLDWL